MKKIVLTIALSGLFAFLHAQEPAIETLFDSMPKKIRGYAGPMINISELDGETAFMSGFNAGAIFNDNFILGLYALDLKNGLYSTPGSKFDYNNRGLWLGYIIMPKKALHFNTNLQIGKGKIEFYDDILNDWVYDDFLFLLTPSVEAEFNVVKFLRVGIGANYRFAFDVDEINNYNDNDFSGLGGFISLKFGWFK